MNADQGDIGRRRRANGCGLDEPAIGLSDGQWLRLFWHRRSSRLSAFIRLQKTLERPDTGRRGGRIPVIHALVGIRRRPTIIASGICHFSIVMAWLVWATCLGMCGTRWPGQAEPCQNEGFAYCWAPPKFHGHIWPDSLRLCLVRHRNSWVTGPGAVMTHR